MRHASKRYKSKVTKLHRASTANDMPLATFSQLLQSLADLKKSRRLKKRYGERLVWEEFENSGSMVSFPLTTLNGKSLEQSSVCLDIDSFNFLQEKYGTCPEEIAAKVIALLGTEED